MHITKQLLMSVFPAMSGRERVKESREAATLLGHPVFSRAVNRLFIELAYEETATLTEPGVDRELAHRRADELRTQRLMLEAMCDRLEALILSEEEIASLDGEADEHIEGNN